jgi:hypothetical protein
MNFATEKEFGRILSGVAIEKGQDLKLLTLDIQMKCLRGVIPVF